jgi:probable rRNA maturation factor
MKTEKKPLIVVDVLSECQPFEVDWARLKGMVEKTLRQHRIRKARVGVCVTDDTGISFINKKHLGHKGPTDVISFDLSDEKGPREFELVVDAELAAREAHKRGLSGDAELSLYVLHGLLHCLGFDDLDPADAKKMHAREDEILQKHGYGATYDPRRM